MAKNIPLENLAHARALIEKFGFGKEHVTIDQFDTFIIDRGLAQDPGTSDVKDNAYKGFVQQRGTARRLLNTAGPWLNGSSFQLVVNKERGGKYSILKWATDANEYAKQITNQVETFVGSRVANLETLRNKAKGLVAIYGEDDELHDSILLLSEMSGHGISMQARVAGLLKQYDTAYAAVTSRLEQAMQKRLEDTGAA
jgi:hypothetical protein